MTKLQDIFSERSINVSAFARNIGVAPTTVYNLLNSKTPERTGVSVWIKVASGLGMTAEELFEMVECSRSENQDQ